MLVDNDKPTDPGVIATHQAAGGRHIQWETGRATEHELFLSLDDTGVNALIARAVTLHGQESVADSIRICSGGAFTLNGIQGEALSNGFQPNVRQLLGDVAHKSRWFKQQGIFEGIARDIVGPRFAQALRQHRGHLPVLVLTHTNAGVCALRLRLRSLGVPARAYRVATIDGFAKRLAATFPRRSQINPGVLELNNPGADYPAIRQAAITVLEGRHLDGVLSATYSRLLVDEYQDCSQTQHRIVNNLALALPTCILGDPMQAIFGFAERLVDWQADVLTNYPSIGVLNIPWRWLNAGTGDLGTWLLGARHELERGHKIDLRTLPQRIECIQVAPDQGDIRRQVTMRIRAATGQGSVLVIGDARNVAGRHQLAGQTPGATVVETVDLRDLTSFGRNFDPIAADATARLLNFASSLMTNLAAAQTLQRLASLRAGRARNQAT